MASNPPAEFNPYAAPEAPIARSDGAILQTAIPNPTYGSLVWRLLAAAIDGCVYFSLLYTTLSLWVAAIRLFAGHSGPVSTPLWVVGMLLVVFIAPYVAYSGLMESSSGRASLGKLAAGLRVTDLYGNRLGVGRASARAFLSLIATALYPSLITTVITRRKATLADMLCGTVVVPDDDASKLCVWWKVPLTLLLFCGVLILFSFIHDRAQHLSTASPEAPLTPLGAYIDRQISMAINTAFAASLVALLVRLTRGARMRKPRWDADTL